MARVKKAVGDLRARIANCSVKAAFALYAAIAIIAAIALTAVFSVVASHVAESTEEEDSDAYSGTFVFDEASNSLVPAEMLSWYEVPAFESLYGQDGTEAPEGESAETGAVILYVEGSAHADSKPIPLGNLPATVPDARSSTPRGRQVRPTSTTIPFRSPKSPPTMRRSVPRGPVSTPPSPSPNGCPTTRAAKSPSSRTSPTTFPTRTTRPPTAR